MKTPKPKDCNHIWALLHYSNGFGGEPWFRVFCQKCLKTKQETINNARI